MHVFAVEKSITDIVLFLSILLKNLAYQQIFSTLVLFLTRLTQVQTNMHICIKNPRTD